MTKAEKFIQDYTMGCSNEIEEGVYHEWLTPEQARKAVEIARDEMLKEFEKERVERIKKVIRQVLNESTTEKDECYSNNRVTQQEVFAWIDKQGKQKKGRADAIAEFQQEWSEEDEEHRQYVNAAVDNYFDVGLAKELRGWLYSLKERVKALKNYNKED